MPKQKTTFGDKQKELLARIKSQTLKLESSQEAYKRELKKQIKLLKQTTLEPLRTPVKNTRSAITNAHKELGALRRDERDSMTGRLNGFFFPFTHPPVGQLRAAELAQRRWLHKFSLFGAKKEHIKFARPPSLLSAPPQQQQQQQATALWILSHADLLTLIMARLGAFEMTALAISSAQIYQHCLSALPTVLLALLETGATAGLDAFVLKRTRLSQELALPLPQHLREALLAIVKPQPKNLKPEECVANRLRDESTVRTVLAMYRAFTATYIQKALAIFANDKHQNTRVDALKTQHLRRLIVECTESHLMVPLMRLDAFVAMQLAPTRSSVIRQHTEDFNEPLDEADALTFFTEDEMNSLHLQPLERRLVVCSGNQRIALAYIFILDTASGLVTQLSDRSRYILHRLEAGWSQDTDGIAFPCLSRSYDELCLRLKIKSQNQAISCRV